MIALRVKLNGKELCLAGADDLTALNTMITALGNLGSKTKKSREEMLDLHLSVGGLTGRETAPDYLLRWIQFQELAVGDKVEIEFVETPTADKPSKKTNAKPPRKKSRT